MDIPEGENWVRGITQVPHVELRVRVVIVGHNKLGGHFGVPHHAGLSGDLLGALLLRLVASVVIEELGPIVVVLGWLRKLEDGLTLFEVPHNDLAIF